MVLKKSDDKSIKNVFLGKDLRMVIGFVGVYKYFY